jgi:aminopeptidase N
MAALINRLLRRPWARDAAWEFIKTEWTTLTRKLGTFQGIPSIVGSLDSFCSGARAADVKQFFTTNPAPQAERALRQTIERIENCAELDTRQSAPLTTWLTATAAR